MEDCFTTEALAEILSDEGLTPEQRAERVLGLHVRAMAEVEAPDPRQSDAYRALQGEFDAYKAMQTARGSRAYEQVKPKFFEMVYGMVDRREGAKPLVEQLAEIRERYEEYFTGDSSAPCGGVAASREGVPAVVLRAGGNMSPGARMTLGEAMRRANAGEQVDVSRIF